MPFKGASIVMAPDGDPTRHKATIKTDKLELTAVYYVAGLRANHC